MSRCFRLRRFTGTAFTILFIFAAASLASAVPLRIERTTVSDNAICIRFNQKLDKIDPALIAISPDIRFYHVNYGNNLYLHAEYTPAEFYGITLQPGFPYAGAQNSLNNPLHTAIIAPDLPPALKFASRGTFFPLHSPYWELPLQQTNLEGKITCTVRQPYPDTLLNFLFAAIDRSDYAFNPQRFSRKIGEYTLTADKFARNTRGYSSLALSSLNIPAGRPGLYVLELSSAESRSQRLIAVTDLAVGLTRVEDTMICMVHSLASPEQGVTGAKVTLYSHKQLRLAEGTTDHEGKACFPDIAIADPDDYAALVVVSHEATGDLSYLSCYYRPENDAFIRRNYRSAAFTDREICRPGEKIRAAAIIRKRQDGSPAANLPLTAVLNGPWVWSRTQTRPVTTDAYGLAEAEFAIPADAPAGSWEIKFCVPGGTSDFSYAAAAFQVAQFTPDQIQFSLTAGEQPPQRQFFCGGKAQYYFGKPVSGGQGRLTAHFQYVSPELIPELRGYTFGWPKEDDTALILDNLTFTTDENGSFHTTIPYPETEFYGLPLRLTLEGTIRGSGGIRPVTGRTALIHHCAEWYLGAKPLTPQGRQIRLQLQAITPDGTPRPLPDEPLCYTLQLMDWQYVLKRANDGTVRNVWEQTTQEVAGGALSVSAEGQVTMDCPVPGLYRLHITAAGDNRRLWKGEIWCERGEGNARSDNPNDLLFQTDAQVYRPGATAHLTFECDFAGTAEIVESGGNTPPVIRRQPVKAGTNTLTVTIPPQLNSGRYFVQVAAAGPIGPGGATPADPQFVRGVAALAVDQSVRQLHLQLDLPQGQTVQPGSTGELTVKVQDHTGAPVQHGAVLLWGVDEGILALCGTRTPDPFRQLYGASPAPFTYEHSYTRLFPLLRVVNGRIGGGMPLAAMDKGAMLDEMRGSRRNAAQQSAVVYLGKFQLDAAGGARATFRYPELNGRLRLMAVAVSENAAGSGEIQATVRTPVTLSLLASAFAAPGDRITVNGSLFNHSDENGSFTLAWQLENGAVQDELGTTPETLTLPLNQERSFSHTFTIPADFTGDNLRLRLTAVDSAGHSYACTAAIAIRPAAPLHPSATTIVVPPGGDFRCTITPSPSDTLVIGAPLLRLQQHLDWLNEYPYGCLEQTVAAAFPQLAIPALVQCGLLPALWQETVREKLGTAVDRIESMRCGNGSYAMWPQSQEPWFEGTVFAVLFKTEAHLLGLSPMTADARSQTVRMMQLEMNRREQTRIYSSAYALSAYIIAALAPAEAPNYIRLLPVEDAQCPQFVRFIAAMAWIRSGHAAEGAALWQQLRDLNFTGSAAALNGILDSPVQRLGLALWLLGDLLPDAPQISRLAADLEALCTGEETSFNTQQHAWTALGLARCAANTAAASPANARLEAQISRAGQPDTVWQSSSRTYAPHKIEDAGSYRIRNTGSTPLHITHNRRLPALPVNASSGFTISREYRDQSGCPVTVFKTGDLLTAVITVQTRQLCENAVICDMLPAGMEIEDPALATRANIRSVRPPDPRTNRLSGARLIERGSDRLLWFGRLYPTAEPQQFSYTIRILTPAPRCAVPPIQVEDMYNPRNFATGLPAAPYIEIK